MKRIAYSISILLLIGFLHITAGPVAAQNPSEAVATMNYYLPGDVSYDESVPTPEEILDMVPGEWHVRHDQLVKYMYALAEASDRIAIREFGRTYENRPLLLLTVTSPSNHANIEQIRQNHLALTDPGQSSNFDVNEMPVVVYMGYSIHGDESSGSNAALLVAYHLAAAQGADIRQKLNNSVILLDPSFNPDGLDRFAGWANTHKSKTVVDDPNNMEQNQPWPGARTNHYWFDLNRDWMLVQHPESQARIRVFHQWKPNILTDHHEMGTNATFFFQPGVPSRTHPLTPDRNQRLTEAIGEYHAQMLDQHKRLYYSKENYDDFYYGKGSTYPDINGSIGILFEQASSRSHAQESIHGVLRFPFTIKNQFLTSLSTLEAAQSLRPEILNHQRSFYREARQQAERSPIEAYVFGTQEDRARSFHLAEMLHRHDIDVYELEESLSANGELFAAGSSYIIPTNQAQHRFIEALFERRTTFRDSLFYDVSAWTMPYAFNMPFAELDSRAFNRNQIGDKFTIEKRPAGSLIGGQSEYAYIFEWDEYYAPRALYRIQEKGVRAKVAAKPFTAVTSTGVHQFGYGSIIVPVGPQEVDSQTIYEWARMAAEQDGIDIYAVDTGLTPSGIDLGSGSFEDIDKPSVALIAGEGTSAYEVGEAWHLLDLRYGMPATLLTKDRLGQTDLDRYTAIVMVDGWYGDLSGSDIHKLKEWVESGGTLVTTKDAVEWARENGLANVSFVEKSDSEEENSDSVQPKPYAAMDQERGAQHIGGAIFHARIDTTHPIGYGYNGSDLTVFRNSTLFMKKSDHPYATPLRYSDDPLASGYISEENLEKLNGTAGIVVSGFGSGKVIAMTDNPNFRAFWYGTNKLFANAIFFGSTISGSSTSR
ncbi:M14 family metallopeptidase [Halalkalibaculum sp. DA3122]|uniref:M14 family metallopeptidase n=1 Tax=Halalkalibaculum sp. DA3122 TaxID=3373607 RepID=UPI003754576C